MKKLDLHIHTIQTVSDKPFDFSMKALRDYIKRLKIDGIAITNHNKFDLQQYRMIYSELHDEDGCIVFPGIEINIGDKKFGHIICITSPEDVNDFAQKCALIEQNISTAQSSISFEFLNNVFQDLNKYLWIPHLDKSPSVSPYVLDQMRRYLLCGEVGSVKKFIYRAKEDRSLTPVYFSDLRPDNHLMDYPTRQTFFDIDNITIAELKKCLIAKQRVTLTEAEGNSRFYVLPDLPISTGLNIVVGERSSGKTYLMDQIAKQYDNIKYIRQFDLIEQDPVKAGRRFIEEVAAKRSSFAEEYFRPFNEVISDVKSVPLREDEDALDNYISCLVKYAQETDRADMFAKCKLYNESLFTENNLNTLKSLIDSVKYLLNANEYRMLINEYIPRSALRDLLFALIRTYRKKYQRNLELKWVNMITKEIKQSLRIRSSATNIPEIDFYNLQLNRHKRTKFNQLANKVKQKTIIDSQKFGRFTVRIEKRPFEGAQELHKFCGKKTAVFSEIVPDYYDNPFKYLHGLIALSDIPETDYYKYFAFVDYQIKNEYGFDVSGGERAEFKLLQEIKVANSYDMLLIDEPESSFDNLFLKNSVNRVVQDLSKVVPVILVTHNNTVGASIKPDYIIYTKRSIHGENVQYKRYFGLPSSKTLKTISGEEMKNITVLMDCLEAGETAYNERKKNYDLLKD